MKSSASFLCLSLWLFLGGLNAQKMAEIDVLHYQASVEPTLADKSIKG